MKKIKIPTIDKIKKGWEDFSDIYVSTLEVNSVKNTEYYFRVLTEKYMPSKTTLLLNPGSSVLEIATGSGLFAEHLFRTNHSNIRDLHLMDLSSKMIHQAYKRFEAILEKEDFGFRVSAEFGGSPEKSIVIKEQNCEDLSNYPDDYFDVVFGNFVVHLTESPQKMVAEVKRVLKPGGFTIFSVLGDFRKSSFFWTYLDLFAEFGKPEDPNRSIFHLGTEEALTSLFEDFTILGLDSSTERIPPSPELARVLPLSL